MAELCSHLEKLSSLLKVHGYLSPPHPAVVGHVDSALPLVFIRGLVPDFVSYVFANIGLFFPNKLGLFSKARAAFHSSFSNSKDLAQRPLQSGSLVEPDFLGLHSGMFFWTNYLLYISVSSSKNKDNNNICFIGMKIK